MPRKCSICTHKKRNEIERDILDSVPFRHIASQFGVSYRAVQRHKQNGHIEESLLKAHGIRQIVHGEDLLGKILHLQEETLTVLEEAKESRNHKTVLDAVGKASGLIALQANLAGQLKEKQQVNIFVNPSFIQMRTIILRELEGYPDLKIRIAEALNSAERTSTGS